MATISPPATGRGGRRSYDAAINLVPYIDLMTTIITFLMMTAVWTQLASLEVQNGMAGKETPAQQDPNTIKQVSLTLMADAIEITSDDEAPPIRVPAMGEGYDMKLLAEQLKVVKDSAEQVDVKLKAEDSVTYNNIAKVIDVASGVGLKAVTLRPTMTT